MKTSLQNKSSKDSVSHNFQDSNKVFNKNSVSSTTALLNHKERCEDKTDNSSKETGLSCPLILPKDTPPHSKVSVEFAASQWFQILLIHINSKNKSLNGVLEPIGECHLGLTGGI